MDAISGPSTRTRARTREQSRTFRFLALPLELREMVYREVIPEEMLLRQARHGERRLKERGLEALGLTERRFRERRLKERRRKEGRRDNIPPLFTLLATCTQIRAETLNLLRTLKPIFGARPAGMAALLNLFGEQVSPIRRIKICGIRLGGTDLASFGFEVRQAFGLGHGALGNTLQACRMIVAARTALEELDLHVSFGPGFELWARDIRSYGLVRELGRLGSFRRVRVTWSSWGTDGDAKCREWGSRLEEILQSDLVG